MTLPSTPDPKDAAELERRRRSITFRPHGGFVKPPERPPESVEVAEVVVPNPVQQLVVRLRLPKLMTWRVRIGARVIDWGVRIAGMGLRVDVEGSADEVH